MSLDFNLAPAFEPGSIEKKWYDFWQEKAIFAAERDIKRKPYTIMLPPPNVTGVLHLGHALAFTLPDVMIRFKKMQGYNTCWVPGTDHAGIATQAVVERKIYQEERQTREELGRDEFLRRVWAWKEEHGAAILNQMREMGFGCDWRRTRFTMDEGLSKAVLTAFVEMFDKGLVYRGARIVNWDCALRTAVSDDEIEMVPQKGVLAYVKYPIADQPGKYVEVATTRPETMFGDTAVAVHPDDERYTDMIGRSVILPLINREIPVIADDTVDPAFGTGAVKVTPGHDPADFERGQRAKLATLIVFNLDGTLNEHCGEYQGLQRAPARKKVLADLEEQGLVSRVEEHEHNVPQSDRSKTVIEPLVSEQWFVRMKELVGPALKAYEEGEISFIPERWGRVYAQWLNNVEDWCISRQLWWGHRIPIYYDEDDTPCAALERPATHPRTGKAIVRQDEDVLDTWFSSALWPFSTLGWPDDSADLDYFYPTAVLMTAPEILYLWVARMVIQGYQFIGKKPFSQVFLNPTIQDEHGKRMSKSAGNGVDPRDMTALYGVDSFRYSLVDLATDKQDCRLNIEREKPAEGMRYGPVKSVKQFENARNFMNKVWNASRFALGNLADIEEAFAALSTTEGDKARAVQVEALEDRWILSRCAETIVTVTDSLERLRFHDATQAVYHFIWDELCDWYLEVIKPRLYGGKGGAFSKALAQATLAYVLDVALKLLHPCAPFITEELWQHLRRVKAAIRTELPAPSILLDGWPKAEAGRIDKVAEEEFAALRQIVRGVRNIRAEHNVPPKKDIPLLMNFPSAERARAFDDWKREIVRACCRVGELKIAVGCERPEGAASVVSGALEAYVPLRELIDPEMERKRLIARIEKLKGHVHGLKRKLENEAYLEKAPKELVAESQALLRGNVEELGRLERNLMEMVGNSSAGEGTVVARP